MQIDVSHCPCLAHCNLPEAWQGRAPSSLVGRAIRSQRLSLPQVSHLEYLYSEYLSFSPQHCVLQGKLGYGLGDLNRLIQGMVPVTCRREVGTSSPSQGCTGSNLLGTQICFPVMQFKGPAHTHLSPGQKPTQETQLQKLSSTWLPGTPLPAQPLEEDKKISSAQHSKFSIPLSHIGWGLHTGSY